MHSVNPEAISSPMEEANSLPMEEAISPEQYARINTLLENSKSVDANPKFIAQTDVKFEDGKGAEYHTTVDGVVIKVRLTKAGNGDGQADHFIEVVAALGSSFRQLGAALPALDTVNSFLGIAKFAQATS
jgi:hypothetical protein